MLLGLNFLGEQRNIWTVWAVWISLTQLLGKLWVEEQVCILSFHSQLNVVPGCLLWDQRLLNLFSPKCPILHFFFICCLCLLSFGRWFLQSALGILLLYMTSILRQTGQWYQSWNWVRGITQPCKMFRAVFDCLLRFIQEFLHWVLHSSSLISQGNSHQLIRWKIIHTIVSCIYPAPGPRCWWSE